MDDDDVGLKEMNCSQISNVALRSNTGALLDLRLLNKALLGKWLLRDHSERDA